MRPAGTNGSCYAEMVTNNQHPQVVRLREAFSSNPTNPDRSPVVAIPQLPFPQHPIAIDHYYGGGFQPGQGAAQSLLSPYTGKPLAVFNEASPEQLKAAVAAAAKAQLDWRVSPIRERAAALGRFMRLVERDLDRLGAAAAMESGKTWDEGRAGVLKGLEVAEYAVSLANGAPGAVQEVSRGITCRSLREPLGVVAGIAPFNFPAMVPMWMFPIALVCGNAFILKPSPKVPLTSFYMAQLMAEAGMPAGLFNTLTGGRALVEQLIDEPAIKAIGFVGSSAVARTVYARAASHGKRCLALGGAKNPLILTPDADPALAVQGVVDSFTGCAGQRCMAGSLLITAGNCEALLAEIVARASAIRLGRDMGAIIDAASHNRLLDAIGRSGAELLLDGRSAPPPAGGEGGNWLGPTILRVTNPAHFCARDELFGPILTVIGVNTLSEALALERSSAYGNAVAVFTSSGAVADTVAREASAGMVGINIGVPVPREPFSFGGSKASKFGTGDITGAGGLEFWTQTKKITVKWSPASDHNWMS